MPETFNLLASCHIWWYIINYREDRWEEQHCSTGHEGNRSLAPATERSAAVYWLTKSCCSVETVASSPIFQWGYSMCYSMGPTRSVSRLQWLFSTQCCALQSCSTKTSTKMTFKMNDRVLISNMSQAMRQTGNWKCKAGDCVINFLSAQDTHKLDTTVLLTVLIFFSVVTAFCFLINFNEHFNKCSIYSHQYFFLSAWMCFSVGLFP